MAHPYILHTKDVVIEPIFLCTIYSIIMDEFMQSRQRRDVGKSTHGSFYFSANHKPVVLIFMDGLQHNQKDAMLKQFSKEAGLTVEETVTFNLPTVMMPLQDSLRYRVLRRVLTDYVSSGVLTKGSGKCVIMTESPYSEVIWLLLERSKTMSFKDISDYLKYAAQSVSGEIYSLSRLAKIGSNWSIHFIHFNSLYSQSFEHTAECLFGLWLYELNRALNRLSALENTYPRFGTSVAVYNEETLLNVRLYDFLKDHLPQEYRETVTKKTISIKQIRYENTQESFWFLSESEEDKLNNSDTASASSDHESPNKTRRGDSTRQESVIIQSPDMPNITTPITLEEDFVPVYIEDSTECTSTQIQDVPPAEPLALDTHHEQQSVCKTPKSSFMLVKTHPSTEKPSTVTREHSVNEIEDDITQTCELENTNNMDNNYHKQCNVMQNSVKASTSYMEEHCGDICAYQDVYCEESVKSFITDDSEEKEHRMHSDPINNNVLNLCTPKRNFSSEEKFSPIPKCPASSKRTIERKRKKK